MRMNRLLTIPLVFSGLLFMYLLFPKYQFFDQGRARCNKITGKVEYWKDASSGWVELKHYSFKTGTNDFGFIADK